MNFSTAATEKISAPVTPMHKGKDQYPHLDKGGGSSVVYLDITET